MAKILGNQVLQKEIPKGKLSFLTRNSKRLLWLVGSVGWLKN